MKPKGANERQSPTRSVPRCRTLCSVDEAEASWPVGAVLVQPAMASSPTTANPQAILALVLTSFMTDISLSLEGEKDKGVDSALRSSPFCPVYQINIQYFG